MCRSPLVSLRQHISGSINTSQELKSLYIFAHVYVLYVFLYIKGHGSLVVRSCLRDRRTRFRRRSAMYVDPPHVKSCVGDQRPSCWRGVEAWSGRASSALSSSSDPISIL
ncbi:hypothetical protein AVEN_269959-1 [Araneus ventricosus]|uniref:Uncharacterized protein n=1 Tax=Araneus ventricosus TaxID=182803 RepID=A0A4Y2PHY9_ARAVE|nr:hypothetical protein AVEN_269959-1 [Araneus ventricosus]